MLYENTVYAGTATFLAADDFTAIPGHVTGTEKVKAGTPLKADGTVSADATGAVGITLYEVDPNKDPNVALVVKGVVDLTKMNTISGLSLTAAQITAVLPGIVCRENIGVNA